MSKKEKKKMDKLWQAINGSQTTNSRIPEEQYVDPNIIPTRFLKRKSSKDNFLDNGSLANDDVPLTHAAEKEAKKKAASERDKANRAEAERLLAETLAAEKAAEIAEAEAKRVADQEAQLAAAASRKRTYESLKLNRPTFTYHNRGSCEENFATLAAKLQELANNGGVIEGINQIQRCINGRVNAARYYKILLEENPDMSDQDRAKAVYEQGTHKNAIDQLKVLKNKYMQLQNITNLRDVFVSSSGTNFSVSANSKIILPSNSSSSRPSSSRPSSSSSQRNGRGHGLRRKNRTRKHLVKNRTRKHLVKKGYRRKTLKKGHRRKTLKKR